MTTPQVPFELGDVAQIGDDDVEPPRLDRGAQLAQAGNLVIFVADLTQRLRKLQLNRSRRNR